MSRRPIALLCAVLALGGVAAAPAEAGKVPNGKYSCYLDYGAGPVYSGRYITITSRTGYRWFNGSRLRSGTFAHKAGERLRFTKGPLAGKNGKHVTYGNGVQGVNITFRTSQGPSVYRCS